MSITNSTPDGSLHYGVVCSSSSSKKGWIAGDAVELLSSEDAARVPPENRLSIMQLLQHVTLVRVEEEWEDFLTRDPATLSLPLRGEILQLCMVRGDWAHGLSLEAPSRRGWFPLAVVSGLEAPNLAALASKDEEPLLPVAADAVVELLRAAGPPKRQQWDCPRDPPARVMQSASEVEKDFKEKYERLLQAEVPPPRPPDAGRPGVDLVQLLERAEANPDDSAALMNLLNHQESLPEEHYPLVVCKMAFCPQRGLADALLRLEVGDLVRVKTELAGQTMCFGSIWSPTSRPVTRSGWFPRRNVEVVEDPLDDAVESMPLDARLPQVPDWLLRRCA